MSWRCLHSRSLFVAPHTSSTVMQEVSRGGVWDAQRLEKEYSLSYPHVDRHIWQALVHNADSHIDPSGMFYNSCKWLFFHSTCCYSDRSNLTLTLVHRVSDIWSTVLSWWSWPYSRNDHISEKFSTKIWLTIDHITEIKPKRPYIQRPYNRNPV